LFFGSERVRERVEESPEGRYSFPVQIAIPCFGGPFDSLGGTRSLRVTVGLSLGASESDDRVELFLLAL